MTISENDCLSGSSNTWDEITFSVIDYQAKADYLKI